MYHLTLDSGLSWTLLYQVWLCLVERDFGSWMRVVTHHYPQLGAQHEHEWQRPAPLCCCCQSTQGGPVSENKTHVILGQVRQALSCHSPIRHVMHDRSHEDPEGAVVVAVAENRLTSSLLTAKLLSLRDFPEESYKYQPPRGSMRLRAALVSYLQHTFMKVLKRECSARFHLTILLAVDFLCMMLGVRCP